MKHLIWTCICLLQALLIPAQNQVEIAGYDLVWSEEFDYEGAPDASFWSYEQGFVRNEELQWYQPGNAVCRNGALIITGKKERVANPNHASGSSDWKKNRRYAEYTSSSIKTAGKKEFLFGRFEVRAKIPISSGSWPAIWTLGNSMPWPSNGEIDIMEYYQVDGVPHILANAAWGTSQEYVAQWDSEKIPFSRFTAKDPAWADKFHIWRMDWDEEAIRLYLDDELLNETLLIDTQNGSIGNYTHPFKQPHYLLLNLAIGKNGGTPDDSAFPLNYEIDYVRVYQKSEVQPRQGNVVTREGAWCWFADPRALHYENVDKSINSSYIGYIDVHGNIKATQHNFLTGETDEVLVRSWFQPDDHDNPTFLVLPDERMLIFYSRHTDEPCFYYRISQKPGDITTLGEEKKLITANNTTYPSPFILSNDPEHIYLCWRGINWHPTIARLTLPDADDNLSFDWGPKQIVQSSGARPYAKYYSNGTDKIYLTCTTGHPDNESPNFVYFNYIQVTGSDASKIKLTDVKGKELSVIDNGVHNINKTEACVAENPDAVVDNSGYRDWVWQVASDQDGKPVVAMVRISSDKTSHDYYCAQWTGREWRKTFLANGGGHFHQTPSLEMCYSGGMAIDHRQPNSVYCSVPVEGASGKVYEIVRYVINTTDYSVTSEAVTQNSTKNNVRPYVLSHSGNAPQLVWMHGDYYDWIVSSTRPNGYPTAIHSNFEWFSATPEPNPEPIVNEDFYGAVNGNAIIENGLLLTTADTYASIPANINGDFTVSLLLCIDKDEYGGNILQFGDFNYGLNVQTLKPCIEINGKTYGSTNVLGNSDAWKTRYRGTNGQWYDPVKLDFFTLSFTYKNGVLRTYINGLIDQFIEIPNLSFQEIKTGGFKGKTENCLVFDRALSQDEIRSLVAERDEQLALRELEELSVPVEIYTDIVLKTATESGYALTWTSSNPALLSETGIVSLPLTPTPATLTVTMGNHSKTFQVTVHPRNIEKNKVFVYRFQETDKYEKDGIGYVSDQSGNANDARIYGNAQINGTLDLTANTSAAFSTNGYLTVPDGLLSNLWSYSFLMKVNPARLDKLPRIYDFGSSSSNSLFGRADALTVGFKYNGATTLLVNSFQTLVTGKDTYLAFTFDAHTHTTQIYVDGELTANSAAIRYEPCQLSLIAPNNRNYIGRSQWQNSDNVDFCGTMDDFCLFDIALTRDEIIQSGSGANNISALKTSSLFLLYPNPVRPETNVFIDYRSASDTKCGYTVEIVGLQGSIVHRLHAQTFPVSIGYMKQAGVYFVRIKNGHSNVCVKKLIVV